MEQELKRETMVIGHRNPDTDSICSVICYADLKRAIIGDAYIPAKADCVSGGIRFVLDYFGTEESKLVEGMKIQVKDIEICKIRGVADSASLKKTWNIMQESNVMTIPSVRSDGILEGLITIGDITKTYMNIYDSSILPRAYTQYSNIAETLEADIVVGSMDVYFDKGKVLIAVTNSDLVKFYIEPHGPVIPGNRYESQPCAIETGVDCIIACEGAGVSMIIKKIAQDKGCTVIAATYDIYTVARPINQSISVSYFMTGEHLITLNSDDYTDGIREVTANKRRRDFPIPDKKGGYLGMTSRRDLLGVRDRQVILVGHNERSQAVAGTESAEIMEVIGHHGPGTVRTMALVFFHNQPLDCAATTTYQMYLGNKVDAEPRIAGLLCSAIVSDTLLFRLPTCTPVDEVAARSLAAITGLDIERYAMEMFRVGGNLKDKPDEETFYQDFKRLPIDETLIGVRQTTSLNGIEPETLKEKMPGYTEKAKESNSPDMAFSILTNILKESMDLTYYGQGVVQLAAEALHLDIEEAMEKPESVLSPPGVVSRKKQLISELMLVEQDWGNGPVGRED